MGRCKTLTQKEISPISAFKQENYSIRQIGITIGRDHKTIIDYLNNPENYEKNQKGCKVRATTERERRSVLHEASNSAASARKIKVKIETSARIRTVQRLIKV